MMNPSNGIPDYIRMLSAGNEAKNGQNGRIDYGSLWAFLEWKGKECYGQGFSLREEDASLIGKLLIWCTRDQYLAERNSVFLHKGILLTGPVGCGKTALMLLLRHILVSRRCHQVYSCRQIAFQFAEEGFGVIGKYSRHSFHPYTPIPLQVCFDDLGLETEMQHYGTPCNVMAEILLSRYDYFISCGMITHLTTNLNSSEIEARYGRRLRSRMKEMFNLISFPQSAGDKRK